MVSFCRQGMVKSRREERPVVGTVVEAPVFAKPPSRVVPRPDEVGLRLEGVSRRVAPVGPVPVVL